MAALALALITVGKPRAGYVREGLADYAVRLKPQGGCELLAARPEKGGGGRGPEAVKAAEGERLLAFLRPGDAAWALDGRGAAWRSEDWARELLALREDGSVRRLCLLVGGAEGLAAAVRARAQRVVSLGPPTLAHELAALVALEQLYRAHAILAGTPYHRGA